MSDLSETDANARSLTASTTTTTRVPRVSHEPQHWHHHTMTVIASSTVPSQSSHSHHFHHHAHNNSQSKIAYTIRPGTPTDLKAIHKIYTYYALNSSITLLVHAPNIKYVEKAYETSISRHMPYLVAVTKATTPLNDDRSSTRATNGQADSNPQTSDTTEPPASHEDMSSRNSTDTEIVLGYAHVVPLHADKAGYAPAVELTMYLHPSYINFGIGSALLLALELQLAKTPILVFEEGYEDDGIDRLAEVLVSRVSSDLERDFEGVRMDGHGDDNAHWPVWKAQGEKNRNWYLRKGFEEVGRMKGVGEKFGRK